MSVCIPCYSYNNGLTVITPIPICLVTKVDVNLLLQRIRKMDLTQFGFLEDRERVEKIINIPEAFKKICEQFFKNLH